VVTNAAAGAAHRNVVIPAELFAKLMGLSAVVQPRVSVLPPLVVSPPFGREGWHGSRIMKPRREKRINR